MNAAGTVPGEPTARAELERWYRRLLRAYPTGYRRAYGDEMMALLMDSAEPGRRRPARADVTDLALSALRQWFRWPASLSAIVATVLAVVVLGAVGAAAGSWLSWQSAAGLPSATAAGRIDATVAGLPRSESAIQRYNGPGAAEQDVSVSNENRLTDWTLQLAQQRLRADGWTPGQVQQGDAHAYRDDERLTGTFQVFEGTRDGLVVTAYAQTIATPGADAGTLLRTRIHPAQPASVPLLTAAGWLGGAIVAWLLTGWAGRRLRRCALPRRLATLVLGLTALGFAAHPTIGLYKTLGRLAFTGRDVYGVTPAYRWIAEGQAAWLVIGILAAGLGILILAATGRRQPPAQPAVTA